MDSSFIVLLSSGKAPGATWPLLILPGRAVIMQPQTDITQLLIAYTEGNREALDRLMPLVYEHLKGLAHARLRQERSDHTLNTTGLVHEAYLKLIDINQVAWQSRGHFFVMASKVMRRILVNYATMRKAQKRGGGAPIEELREELLIPEAYAETLLDLDDLLQRFEKTFPREAEVVEHRYFGGLTNEEIAETLSVSLSTVERDLRFARAWLSEKWSGDLAL